MTHLLEKHEAIITSYLSSLVKDAKDGEIVQHYNQVQGIHFYQQDEDGKYRKVFFTKEMVTDFYNKIQEIESQTKPAEYTSLPF